MKVIVIPLQPEDRAERLEVSVRSFLTFLILYSRFSYTLSSFFPDYFKTADANINWGEDDTKERILKVYPNPAGDYCIIEYDLSLFFGEAVISITDLYGKTLFTFIPENVHTQKVLPLSDYAVGIYFVNLLMDNNEKESVKLIIVE